MSIEREYTLTCSCGRMFHADLYDTVNVTAEPELRQSILQGRLNVVQCPRCHRECYVDKPFLYHDMDRDLLLYIYPEACAPEEAGLRDEISRHVRGVPHQEVVRRKTIGLLFGINRLVAILSAQDPRVGFS
ncbi:MAG: hypothetical protein HY321_01610 [Armatimonadetes bacterium]|nr:hypothetical protein [Armatimonadota bacterium]